MTAATPTATQSNCFAVDIADGVAHIRLNRPDAFNAMNRDFWNELPEIVRDIDDHARARCIVVSSTGKHFSAGMDLKVFEGVESVTAGGGDRHTAMESFRRHVHHLQGAFSCLDQARMPVLAAIQGGCIGGGVDLVSACDIRYATADAFFCIQEINIGMTADVGTLQRISKVIPEGIARELAYTGDRMPAERAYECGLVNQVFDDHESLVDGTLDIAARIATKSPLAIWGTKEMLNFTRDHTVADSLKYMAGWQSGMFQPGDMMESFGAKADDRPAEFEPIPHRPSGI